jgi:hypothetical protein
MVLFDGVGLALAAWTFWTIGPDATDAGAPP